MLEHKLPVAQAVQNDLPIKARIQHESIEQIHNSHQDRSSIAKTRDLPRKLAKAHLQGAVAHLTLYLGGNAAQKGGVANRLHQHLALALQHGTAAEHKRLVVRCPLPAARGFLHSRALARHAGLIHAQASRQHSAVRRDHVPRLQQHHVAHHDLCGRHLPHFTRAAHAARPRTAALGKPCKRRLRAVLRHGGDQRGKKHRHSNAHRFKPIRLPKHQKDMDSKRTQQHLDDRIAQVAYELADKSLFLFP